MSGRGPASSGWAAEAWRVLHDHSPAGFAILDHGLRYVAVNATLATRNRMPAADHIGRTPRDVVPGLADAVQQACTQVLTTGKPIIGLELSGTVASAPGRVRHWVENVYPVPDSDGAPVGVAVLIREATGRLRAGLGSANDARRLLVLHRLSEALADAVDRQQVAQAVVDLADRTLDAQGAVVASFDGARCQVLAATGPPGVRQASSPGPFAAAAYPAVAAALGPRPHLVRWSSTEDKDRRFPPPPGGRPFSPGEAGAIAPMLADGRPVGFVGVAWDRPRRVGPGDADLLRTMAAQTSAAMERARLFEAERRAQRRLRLLADVSAELACTGEELKQLTRLADLLVNDFADFASVLLPDGDGRLRRLVNRAARPAPAHLLAALRDNAVPEIGDDVRLVAWRSGRVARQSIDDLTPYLGDIPPAVAADIARVAGHTVSVAAPITARGEALGVVHIAFWTSDRCIDEDLHLLADIGHRAGIAIDNLRLLAAQTRIAARLQDALLPAALPAVPGVELAARYLPAEHGASVGGDFYDVFQIDDAYALVIGDVVGRGVDAAGLTGTARATLRALADHLPAEDVLARLNTLLAQRPGDIGFLTLAFLMLRPHPAGATAHIWLAGHPLPLLVRPDGTVTELGVPGHLLGVLPDVTHHRHTVELAPGDLLLLYTDGLVEAHGPEGLFGQARLPAMLTGLAGASAPRAVDELVRAVTGYRTTSADDTAILAVRLPPTRLTTRSPADRSPV